MTAGRHRGRAGAQPWAAAAVLFAVIGAAVLPVVAVPGTQAAAATSPASGVTLTKTVERVHLVSGSDQVVDRRTVTVTFSQTTGLRDRQVINVSWTGAHPTGGLVADVNSPVAMQQEYPMVILECRGLDSTAVPVAKRVSPQTCWTRSSQERYQEDNNFTFPAWRLDRFATAADRGEFVNQPTPYPKTCFLPPLASYWVPMDAADGQVYEGGAAGCAGMAPEASNALNSLSLPSNETFAASRTDGTGSANFDVWTADTNATLGCSDTVPCSLVAIPIEGISCDPAAKGLPADDVPPSNEAAYDAAVCELTGHYTPGGASDLSNDEDLTVSGTLWWAASNWRNRLSVPITFEPSNNVCGLVSNAAELDVYGSELFGQASQQWEPHFCLGKGLFAFKHVQTGEPEAKNLLAVQSVEAAFDSLPPPGGYPVPTVNAPTAVTGYAIGFAVDDVHGQPLQTLRLDARLIAKLLTESYPAISDIQKYDSALSHNPLNMTADPEFQALNPTVPKDIGLSIQASELIALSSDSDVMQWLTTYINDDPAARAWLNGQPDPWGMTVNPAYKGIQLPVNSWPLLDTFEPTTIYQPGLNDCLYNNPLPYLPLVASPTQRLAQITLDVEFALPNSQVVCVQVVPGQSQGEKLVSLPREVPGQRFLLGIVPIADAERYRIPMASLETSTTAAPGTAITSPAGSTFAAPTPSSLAAAMALATPDPTTGTWPIDLTKLSSAPAAYPGTMVVYTSVPTEGLPKADAQRYAQFLDFAAGPGQQQGYGNGQLPPGYLPITSGNGLGDLAAYTARAAAAVADQQGQLPSLTGPGSGPTPSPSPSPGPTYGVPSSGSSGGGTSGGTAGQPTGPGSGGSAAAGAGTGGGTAGGRTQPGSTRAANGVAPIVAPPPLTASPGLTPAASSLLAGWALPGALLFAVLAGLLAPVVVGRRRR